MIYNLFYCVESFCLRLKKGVLGIFWFWASKKWRWCFLFLKGLGLAFWGKNCKWFFVCLATYDSFGCMFFWGCSA